MDGLEQKINVVSLAIFKLLCRTCTREYNKEEALIDYQLGTRKALAIGGVKGLSRVCFQYLVLMILRSINKQFERLRSTNWNFRAKMRKWVKAFLVLSSVMFLFLCYWTSSFHAVLLLVAAAVPATIIVPGFFIDCAVELDWHTKRSGWSGLTRIHFALVLSYSLGCIVYHAWQNTLTKAYPVIIVLALGMANYYIYNIVPARRASGQMS